VRFTAYFKVEKAEPIENEIFEENIEKDKRRSQKATEGKGLWKRH